MKNYEKITEKQKETEKHKTCSFLRRSFFKKEFKECDKDGFTKLLFCKFNKKRETRSKRKHKGTFLSQKDQQGRNTVFVKTDSYKRKHFLKKTLLFCEERRVRKRKIKKKQFFKRKNDSQKRMRLFKTSFFFFQKS